MARIGTVAFCAAVLGAGGVHVPAPALAAPTAPTAQNGLIAWSKPSFVRPAEIWVVHPDGSKPHGVGSTGQTDFTPAWSADGKRIAYASSGADVDIWVMTARGNHPRNVTNDPNNPDLDPSWSPDGLRIAFWKQNFDQTGSVWVIDADGTDPVQLTDDAVTNQRPAWSPDGSTIAFVSNRNGSNELYLMDPDGTNVRQVTDTPKTWEDNPDWSPDGTRLAYDACVSDTYPCPGTPNNEIYTIKPNGNGRRTLTDFGGIDANPAWSPDGTRIVFRSDRTGDSQLWTMDTDGSNLQQVTFKNLTGATDPDWQPLPATPVAPAPARVVSFDGHAATLQTVPGLGALAPRGGEVPAATAKVRVHTVDADTWTGYENAVYAADATTVYVAYKRFLQDPHQQEYTPAELRVAKSIDAGKTWSVSTVDPDAVEDSQILDSTVSIDGDGGSTIYVAYHTRSSGLYASMRLELATSTDGGANWTIHDVATSNAGDYNAIRVLDANTAVIAAHGAGGSVEGLHVYVTKDGGATVSDTTVESGLGLGLYNGIGASDTRHMVADDYDSLSDNTDLHGDRYRPRSHTWKTTVIDGQPGVGLTGLGASMTMPSASRAYAAYEQDVTGGPYVKVASTTDGGRTWSPVVVEKNPTIGWNTAVDAVGAADVFVSYWWVGSGNVSQAHLGVSHDGGATWNVLLVPEERSVQPYIDLSAVAGRRFVSYQSSAPDGTAPLLRIAVFG